MIIAVKSLEALQHFVRHKQKHIGVTMKLFYKDQESQSDRYQKQEKMLHSKFDFMDCLYLHYFDISSAFHLFWKGATTEALVL